MKLSLGLTGLATAALALITGAASAGPGVTPQITLPAYVKHQLGNIVSRLEKGGSFAKAEQQTGVLFDQVVAYGPSSEPILFRHVDYTLRLIDALRQVHDGQTRTRLLSYLTKNPKLAETLLFLIQPGTPQVSDELAMLEHLHKAVGAEAAQYPNLTSAICVVLYRPLRVHINENAATSPDPVALFKYYVKHQSLMYFGIKHVPAELLEYVVDTTSSIPNLKWALARYHGNPLVGSLFFRIRYDYSALRSGRTAQLDSHGFNLPNILAYGGVCADQAYYASEVAKAIGVPSAYDTGLDGVVGHAWVGFLQAQGTHGWWNFNVGRYAEYQGILGETLDPVSRRQVPDTYISLSGQLIHTTAHGRWNSTALTDAADRLIVSTLHGGLFNPPALPSEVRAEAVAIRGATVRSELDLLYAAVSQCNGYAPAWFSVRALAIKHKLTYSQKEYWADKLMSFCGTLYPDFAMAVVSPMIETVRDVQEQNDLWNKAFVMFEQKRFDLAANVRMHQAAMWEKANRPNRAGQCYMDVIQRFANAGPFVRLALTKAAAILEKENHPNRVLTLYEQTWTSIKPPPRWASTFVQESNWYKVGKTLEQKLTDAGKTQLAKKVGAMLASGV
ncbi:MAG: hypothetical protein HKL96_07580 [Phycisphaerales bacterium]|nr:hypothetical protein [Phycisphaerales bacterium]